MYPAILICVAIAVIIIMLVKVVPVFQTMFTSIGHSLPAPTQLIVSISEFARNPMQGGLLMLAIISSVAVTHSIIKKNKQAQYKFDTLLLKIPLFGEVIEKSILAKIAMLEGNLGAAGVPVLEAFDIIGRTIKNLVYKNALGVVKKVFLPGKNYRRFMKKAQCSPSHFHNWLL